MVRLLKEFLIWVTRIDRLVLLALIILALCLGCLIWNSLSLREVQEIEYFELTFSDSRVEVFDVREFEIVKTTNVVIVKEILKGYAVFSDNSKREIYFYPQANTFRFANENQNYRIKCKGMLVYPLT